MMKALLKKCFAAAESLVWPGRHQCLHCGCLSDGELLCGGCRQELAALDTHGRADLPGICSVYWHDGCAGSMVHGLKFRGVADCAAVLAAGMAEAATALNLPEDTVLTWVPMPRRRLRERGIDHCRTLCSAVAAETGRPVLPLLRRAAEDDVAQLTLSRAQRLENLRGAFRAEDCEGMHVLLIDDVRTTGATAKACREALLRAGARRVWVLTATTPRQTDIPD